MKIYVDINFHCHTTNPDGTFREIETDFFEGKCKTLIDGYCYDDRRAYVQIYPWKDFSELDAAQTQYEYDMAELQNAYREGVNSV